MGWLPVDVDADPSKGGMAIFVEETKGTYKDVA